MRVCNRVCCWTVLGLLVLALSSSAPIALGQSTDEAAMDSRLAESTRYLSSDPLEGRGPGTRGIELAADYIAGQFHAAGLMTNLCEGTPFQHFKVTLNAEAGAENRLALVGPAEPGAGRAIPVALSPGVDFKPLAASDSVAFELPLVFVGYGITDHATQYDDYAGMDVTGKAVILLRGEPARPGGDGASPVKTSRHAVLRRKLCNAYEHGAAAVIVCNTEADVRADKNHQDTLVRLGKAGFDCSHPGMAVVHCRRAVLEPAVREVFGVALAELETQINRGPGTRSRLLTGWRVTGHTDIRRTLVPVKNVVGLLRGDGSSHGQAIVVGAHYDHFGYSQIIDPRTGRRAIYSGADDNASGVSAIIEIARHLGHRSRRPAHDVLFISFSGEEEGLCGSAYYVSHPLVPLNRTVAMVNFDMVGRLKNNRLNIRGAYTAQGWDKMLIGLNARYGLTLELPRDKLGNSDQLSFYAKEIPMLAFFTMRHEDYHETTDKFDKLNIPGMGRVVRLAEDAVTALADGRAQPAYLASVPEERTEPYFGAFCDFTRDEGGCGLGPLADGGPAQKAGLRDGDLVVRFGENRIANPDDFSEALTHYQAGEKVHVVVKRGGQSRAFDVRLGLPQPLDSAKPAGRPGA